MNLRSSHQLIKYGCVIRLLFSIKLLHLIVDSLLQIYSVEVGRTWIAALLTYYCVKHFNWPIFKMSLWYICSHVHPKLHNINPHNVTHSLISQSHGECMFVVQIPLLIVTLLSLISRNLSSMQTTKEVDPYPRIMPCVKMWSVTFFFFFLWHLSNVGACICHIT